MIFFSSFFVSTRQFANWIICLMLWAMANIPHWGLFFVWCVHSTYLNKFIIRVYILPEINDELDTTRLGCNTNLRMPILNFAKKFEEKKQNDRLTYFCIAFLRNRSKKVKYTMIWINIVHSAVRLFNTIKINCTDFFVAGDFNDDIIWCNINVYKWTGG